MRNKLMIIIPVIILVLTILLISTLFFGVGFNRKDNEDNSIIGLWNVDDVTKIKFNNNGKGKVIVPGEEFLFSYTIKDNIISIDFENEESNDVDYEYKLDKDILEITNTKETYLKFELKRESK